jgi:hypothetical protein
MKEIFTLRARDEKEMNKINENFKVVYELRAILEIQEIEDMFREKLEDGAKSYE